SDGAGYRGSEVYAVDTERAGSAAQHGGYHHGCLPNGIGGAAGKEGRRWGQGKRAVHGYGGGFLQRRDSADRDEGQEYAGGGSRGGRRADPVGRIEAVHEK